MKITGKVNHDEHILSLLKIYVSSMLYQNIRMHVRVIIWVYVSSHVDAMRNVMLTVMQQVAIANWFNPVWQISVQCSGHTLSYSTTCFFSTSMYLHYMFAWILAHLIAKGHYSCLMIPYILMHARNLYCTKVTYSQESCGPSTVVIFLSYSEKAWACVQNGITQRGRLADGDMTTSP